MVTLINYLLAGSEAAYQLAKRNIKVRLYEMRPNKMTSAHKTNGFAELICSNSLRAAGIENAVGLLKEEMRRFDSLIIRAADATKVEASTTNGNIKINGTETTVYTHPSGTNPHGTTKSDL